MTSSDEKKMKAFMLLKRYHDLLVEINKASDIIKNYKLHFTDQLPLPDQLNELYTTKVNLQTEIIYKDGKIKKQTNEDQTPQEKEEPSVVNRKNPEVSTNKDKTIDADSVQLIVSDCIIKNNYYLDFSKQQRSKKLITEIKTQYTKLLINNINELMKIKNELAAL